MSTLLHKNDTTQWNNNTTCISLTQSQSYKCHKHGEAKVIYPSVLLLASWRERTFRARWHTCSNQCPARWMIGSLWTVVSCRQWTGACECNSGSSGDHLLFSDLQKNGTRKYNSVFHYAWIVWMVITSSITKMNTNTNCLSTFFELAIFYANDCQSSCRKKQYYIGLAK